MIQTPNPATVEVAVKDLADMALDVWRLRTWSANQDAERTVVVRHATRRLERWLAVQGIEWIDLVGSQYEPGLSVEVVDTLYSDSLPAGAADITEMIAPIVLWKGRIVRDGVVVIRRGPDQAPCAEGGTQS